MPELQHANIALKTADGPGAVAATSIAATSVTATSIAADLKSQYKASLEMLRDAIEKCPDELWDRDSDLNKTWQIAYHALYFSHLYSERKLEDFEPWSGQHSPTQNDDAIPGPTDPKSSLPLIPTAYSREEILRYWLFCHERIDATIDRLDLASPSSGFNWYPISKLEHQFVTLRHLMQHTGQLMERVRNAGGDGVRWRGAVRE